MTDKNKELRDKFEVTGYFYMEGGLKFRKYLNIRLKGSNLQQPDLMVVMMNPGSSEPVNGDDNGRCETETIPDDAQDQIMKVMIKTNYNYARVLNLSDLREPDSEKFDEFLKTDIGMEEKHSIFHESRICDFRHYFVKNVPVIYAWGVSKKLRKLAESAMNRINHPNPIGRRKEGCSFCYYHPLPRGNKEKQKKWVDKIVEALPSKFNSQAQRVG